MSHCSDYLRVDLKKISTQPREVRHVCESLPVIVAALVAITACSGEPSAALCGDGVLDPDEACDDGNRESGDACTSTCRITGSQLECTTLLEGTDHDEINGLLALPDLSFVAAGSKDYELPWIGRYDDSGMQIWQTWPSPADEATNIVMDLAADSSGGYWMLIDIGGDEDLIHFDASGQIDDRQTMSALAPMEGVRPRRLLVVDDDVWLAGTHGADSWVGRFDSEAHSLSTILIDDYAGFYDVIWAIAQSKSEVAVAATVDTGPSQIEDMLLTAHSNVLLIRFDRQGHELGRHLLGSADPETATTANSIAADADDGWIVGGNQHSVETFTPQEAWVARVQPSEGWTWTWTSGGAWQGDDVNDILVTEHEVVVAGTSPAGYERRGWLLGLGLDGAPHWEHTFVVQGYTDSVVAAIVLDDTGRLRTAINSWYDPWDIPNADEVSLLQSCLVAW
jgi:cysteine-rich repeat protein